MLILGMKERKKITTICESQERALECIHSIMTLNDPSKYSLVLIDSQNVYHICEAIRKAYDSYKIDRDLQPMCVGITCMDLDDRHKLNSGMDHHY